jgi:glycosyltransferase involved in cell wall biosynthesis
MSTAGRQVSVVIPVHNGAEHIEEQLEAVAKSLRDVQRAEVIVVDNKSTDETGAIVAAWAADSGLCARLLPAHEKAGEPYARNVGWRSATGDCILFCDADDRVGATWAEALVKALESAEFATGPLETTEINAPDVAQMRGQAIFRSLPVAQGIVPFAHGANMAFRRSTLEALDGFDEDFLIGCDVEIAVRAWQAGVALVWTPAALVHYRLRSAAAEVYRQAHSYGRARRRIDAKLADEASRPAHRWARHARRGVWLIRHSPGLWRRGSRLKWLWVAGQVTGEIKGYQRGSRA